MSQALPCVLTRVEGPFSSILFRNCIDSVCPREGPIIHWVTDADFPIDTEASENYVWNSIARRLGTSNDLTELRCILHSYSSDRTLAAITGHPSLATDESLLSLVQSGMTRYADALNETVMACSKSDVRLGTSLSLPTADWSWSRLAEISDELLRLISACYICLELFTGYPQISLDFLEPAVTPGSQDTIFSLSVAMKGDMPIGEVLQRLHAARRKEDVMIRDAHLNSLGIIIGDAPSSADRGLQIGDLKVSFTDKQRLAPWAVKLTLPPIGNTLPPRLESTVPLDTASALLTHVYDSLISVPHISISDVTIALEGQNVEAFDETALQR